MKRIALTGASSGIGARLAQRLAARGDEVLSLSRRPGAAGRWIATDLGDPGQIAQAAATIGGEPLDALIHVAGIWEAGAFSDAYDFATQAPGEAEAVIAVNLTAPILLTQALVPALSWQRGQVILVGSTSGLDNIKLPEVAYNASKAGLRAAAQAMACGLERRGIRVTIVNPGDVASREPGHEQDGLAVDDLCAAIEMVLDLSAETVVSEITLKPGPR